MDEAEDVERRVVRRNGRSCIVVGKAECFDTCVVD
jgi:hypothetical protein